MHTFCFAVSSNLQRRRLQHDAVGDNPGATLRCYAGAGTAHRKSPDVPELHTGPVQLLPWIRSTGNNNIISRKQNHTYARSTRLE